MPWIIEKVEINASRSGMTAADGTGTAWGDIWDYEPPTNIRLLIRPGDIFSAYLVGDDASEMPGITEIRVEKRDVSEQDRVPILPPTLYNQVKSFTTRQSVMRLSIPSEIVVDSGEHLVIQVKGADAAATGDTDASASSFKLATTWTRKARD